MSGMLAECGTQGDARAGVFMCWHRSSFELPNDLNGVFLEHFVATYKAQVFYFRLCNKHSVKRILMERLQVIQAVNVVGGKWKNDHTIGFLLGLNEVRKRMTKSDFA
jgi:hypothetical protein